MTELDIAAGAGASSMADAPGALQETDAEVESPASLSPAADASSAGPEPQAENETDASAAGAEPAPAEAASSMEEQPPAIAVHPHLRPVVEKHPGLKQAIEQDPALEETLRNAFAGVVELDEFHLVFPSLDHARKAADHAAALTSFDALYFNESPEAARQLLVQLHENQFLRDPESGVFLTDEQGNRISSGGYDRLTGAYRNILFDTLASRAAAENDRELEAAIQLLKERVDGISDGSGRRKAARKASATPAPAQEAAATEASASESALPADVQARLRRLEEIERRQTEQEQGNWHDYYQSVGNAVEQAVRADIEQALGGAALPAYVRGKLVDDILQDLNRQAGDDASYQNRVQSLLRASNRSDSARQRIVAAARSHARSRIAPVAQRHLNQAMADLRQEQESRGAKVKEQQRRVEVKSAGAAPPPVRRSDSERIRATEQKLGRRLSDREILDL